MLKIEALTKYYGQQCVLDAIDLDVADNITFALIGLNGAGKTTLLRCLLAIQSFDSGSITINGIDSTQHVARKVLSFLPEKFSPPSYMTGLLYLQYINDAHELGFSKRGVLRQRAAALCKQLALEPSALMQAINTYSKGMLQKLGLLATLFSNRSLLILDEPTTGLDPQARMCFRQVIRASKQTGKTILLCSHSFCDIEMLCDRVGILHKGKLLFVGTVPECQAQYQADKLETAFLNCITQ